MEKEMRPAKDVRSEFMRNLLKDPAFMKAHAKRASERMKKRHQDEEFTKKLSRAGVEARKREGR